MFSRQNLRKILLKYQNEMKEQQQQQQQKPKQIIRTNYIDVIGAYQPTSINDKTPDNGEFEISKIDNLIVRNRRGKKKNESVPWNRKGNIISPTQIISTKLENKLFVNQQENDFTINSHNDDNKNNYNDNNYSAINETQYFSFVNEDYNLITTNIEILKNNNSYGNEGKFASCAMDSWRQQGHRDEGKQVAEGQQKQEQLFSIQQQCNDSNDCNDSNQNNNNTNNKKIDYSNLDSFHRAAMPILIVAQCFGLMPVVGIWKSNPKHLRFQFKSLQMLVFLTVFISCSIIAASMLKYLLKQGINAKNLVGLVFFVCVATTCMLFLSLAHRWPDLIRYWSSRELVFTRFPYEKPKRSLLQRVLRGSLLIIVSSLVEHGLYQVSAISNYRLRKRLCAPTYENATQLDGPNFEEYIINNYNYVFEVLPYSKFVGIFILIINGACTFIWNYLDLFIMMISKGIAYRFEQITMRINGLVDKEVSEVTFIEIREHYVKVCELLEYVDDNLSGIILLSCVNNLYFVCYQLLNIFNKLRWPINYVYFWYSLLYLIGRTAYVFLCAAAINDESKGSLGVLRRLPNKVWCVEVERLIFQMATQTAALSGKKFFFLTRRLLFGMAGTIVTYELVLLQFDEPNRSQGLPPLCA